MKLNRLPCPLLVLILATGCQSQYDDDVVSETYVHRYGVPLDPDDWSARGQDGQVVTTMKDGVIVARGYEAGELHGETTYTFPHRDTIQKKEIYDQGDLNHEVWHYSSGAPQKQISYTGPNSYTAVTWYENGAPHCKEQYEQDRLILGEYFNPSYQMESQVVNGQGTRTKRDEFGQMISIDEFQDGEMKLSTTYHPNGSPATITPYANGVEEGQRRTFLPGGEPATIEEWQNGRQHGNTVIFQNGIKFSDMPYRNGQRNGMERRYRNGQELAEEVTWVNDRKHGPAYSYVGDTKRTTWYLQDRETNKATYDTYKKIQ